MQDSILLLCLVSIHASAWEATAAALIDLWRRRSFNPRLRVGGDARCSGVHCPLKMFQSTPPRGRRRQGSIRSSSSQPVSIHASAWEAILERRLRCPGHQVSIHASAWEATQLREAFALQRFVSIHASAWEATGTPR